MCSIRWLHRAWGFLTIQEEEEELVVTFVFHLMVTQGLGILTMHEEDELVVMFVFH